MTTTPTQSRPAADPPVRIDPRIRERRIEVIREAGRRRLRVLLVVSIVLIAVGITFLVVTSPLLDVDHIDVTGARHVSVAEVERASGVHMHAALLFVDLASARRHIEALPWIQSATVHRSFPGTLDIAVREYVPVAYVRVTGGVMLLAANGHAIARVPAPPPHAVEMRGVRSAPLAGEMLSPPEAAGVVGRLPAELAARVVAVDVRGDGLTLDISGNGEIRLGDASDLDVKAASAIAVLRHLGAAHFSYIDASDPYKVAVHG